MITIVVAAMLAMAGNGADTRHDFVQCLKQASTDAKSQKIAADGFVEFAKNACVTVEAPFRSTLVSADVSHGMSRKDSDSDASSQIRDYYSERLDSYKFEVESAAADAAKADAPAKVEAAAKQ
jgi:hypothetical protein